jgi:hypothetical protein
MATDDRTYRGHAFTIDRQRGGPRSDAVPGLYMRTIRVPSLGICEEAWITLAKARDYARRRIDQHIAEHGDAPEEKTAKEREETRDEVFGRF